jgi:hypothetical protein
MSPRPAQLRRLIGCWRLSASVRITDEIATSLTEHSLRYAAIRWIIPYTHVPSDLFWANWRPSVTDPVAS